MEKVLEFDDIRAMGNCDIWDYPPKDKTIEKIEVHFDGGRKKYITKVTYGKKQ